MDTSLESVSREFDQTIQKLIVDTKNDLSKIEDEIEELNVKLQGNDMKTDRSENADYQIASDSRAMKMAMRNLLLQRIESMSHEIGSYVHTGFIALGTTVELNVVTVDGKTPNFKKTNFIFKLVQHNTSKALLNLVAIDSKVGAAILGRTAGDDVTVEAPGGLIKYRIERVY